MAKGLIMVKDVNKSLLWDVFTIPTKLQKIFYAISGEELLQGSKKPIRVFVGGQDFNLTLVNQNLDLENYSNHGDVLQICYSESSKFTKPMRKIFAVSYNYIAKERAKTSKTKVRIKVPEDMREQIVLYKSTENDSYYIECITSNEHLINISNIITEENFEMDEDKLIDSDASFEVREKLLKIRKIDRTICDNLKRLYGYRDQITGKSIGDLYGRSVVEAYHIVQS